MKRTILTYGSLCGITMIALVFTIAEIFRRDLVSIDRAELVGYAGMVVALTLVFVAIRQYKQEKGTLSFWEGFRIGSAITGIAALFYFLGVEVYNLLVPDFGPAFMDKFAEHQIEVLRNGGAAEAEVEAMRLQMASFVEMYKNPFVRFGVALIEFVPVGIVITVICSLLLRQRAQPPTE